MGTLNFRKHQTRHLRFIELWGSGDWKIKIYYISEFGLGPDEEFIRIAKDIAENAIFKIPSSATHYYSAFLTIHISAPFNQIIFDWWEDENELRHLVFKAESSNPGQFLNITSSGKAFCIWELKIIGFERDSWTENVLKTEPPDIEQYYSEVLNTDE